MSDKKEDGDRKIKIGFAIFAVLVVIGGAIYIGLSQRDSSSSESTSSRTTGSSSVKSSYKEIDTIPGIEAVDLHGNLTDMGFKLDKYRGSTQSTWTCTQRTSTDMYEATAYGRSTTEITKISATAQDYTGGDMSKMAAEFLGFIATMPYDGASPAQARAWVESNINSNTSTVIGGVKFEIYGNNEGSRTRGLDMSSANR